MTLIVLWGIFDDPVDGYGEPAGCSCEDDNNNHLGNVGHVLVVNFISNPSLLCYSLYPDQDASVEDNQSSERDYEDDGKDTEPEINIIGLKTLTSEFSYLYMRSCLHLHGVMSVSKAVFHLSRHTSRMKFLN